MRKRIYYVYIGLKLIFKKILLQKSSLSLIDFLVFTIRRTKNILLFDDMINFHLLFKGASGYSFVQVKHGQGL